MKFKYRVVIYTLTSTLVERLSAIFGSLQNILIPSKCYSISGPAQNGCQELKYLFHKLEMKKKSVNPEVESCVLVAFRMTTVECCPIQHLSVEC